MINLSAFDLQEYVDDYNCSYFVEAGTNTESINYALNFPFMRVYSLHKDAALVKEIRERYWFNQRVQVFHRSHDTAFYELARIVPREFSAVIWLTDDFFKSNIDQLAKVRPAKKDVIILDNPHSTLANIVHVNTLFGLTHQIKEGIIGTGDSGRGLLLSPLKRQKSSERNS